MTNFIIENPYWIIFAAIVIWFLIKNHIILTPLDLAKVKSKIIEELKNQRAFVTPEELNKETAKIKTDVETRFLTLAVFNEFKNGIDKQFNAVQKRFNEGTKQFESLFHGLNDIKNILIKK